MITRPEDLMTLDELSGLFRCSKRHLQDLRKRSEFPAPVRCGVRMVRYRRSDIEEFISNGGVQ